MQRRIRIFHDGDRKVDENQLFVTPSYLPDHNIFRFQVAVANPLLVNCIEGAGKLLQQSSHAW